MTFLGPNRWSDLKLRFSCQYTKFESDECDMKVSRLTATKGLKALADAGLVQKVNGSNCFVNQTLNKNLTREAAGAESGRQTTRAHP
jgi:hypothetical protein